MTTPTTTQHEMMQRHHQNTAAQHYEDNDPYKDRYANRENDVFVEPETSMFAKLKDIVSISEVLRFFGAAAVFASMSLFLLNGWSEMNDIQRYLKLFAQTGLLTIAGFIMSYVLKENKGARVFFGLGLISVVANFAVLAAMIYSIFQLDNGLIDYPSMATWTVTSMSTLLPVFIGAIVALALLTRFSFSIFARKIAMPLSASFLLLNALILIPVRSSVFVSLIALAGFFMAYMVVKKLSSNDQLVFTKETKFALSLLFAPSLLIIARAVSLYSIDEILLVLISSMVYTLLRYLAQRSQQPTIAATLLRLTLFVTGLVLAGSVVSLLAHLPMSVLMMIFSVLVVGLSFDQMQYASSAKMREFTLSVTTLFVVGLNVQFAFVMGDIVMQVFSVLMSAGMFYCANHTATQQQQNRFSKIIALFGAIASIILLGLHIIEIINMGNWMLVGLLGATLIVLGSLYERFGLNLTALFSSKNKVN